MADDRSPKIENAPGIRWERHPDGWQARWRPRSDLVARGYPATSYPLWAGSEPTEQDRAYISDQCERLQSEMLVWGRGGIPITPSYDGTLKALIKCYQTDDDSGYRKIRYRTRQGYNGMLRRLEVNHGHELVEDIKARVLLRWHEDWSKSGVATAHSLIGMLRTLFGFGATMLEDEECERLCSVLHKMKFKMAPARKQILTAEQATAIRTKAHEMGHHSIALAQAFQFDCTFRQKDVIGERVPTGEPGPLSHVLYGDEKWWRGIMWSEIDDNLILRHTTSKRQKEVEIDLKLAPMVMEELALIGTRPTSGPVVICDYTGEAWASGMFRHKWRQVATAAGVPKEVYNMDSRAGAITEAFDSGADKESVRKTATHSTAQMTEKYSRGDTKAIAGVMQLRVASRNKSGTEGT